MIQKLRHFIKNDVKETKAFFQTKDVYLSDDKTILKVFALILRKYDILKALKYAKDNACEIFFMESEQRKGIEICFRHRPQIKGNPKKKIKNEV